MSNFLEKLRALNTASFEDTYDLLESIKAESDEFRKKINFNFNPDLFASYQEWLLEDATQKDCEKFKQLFDPLNLHVLTDPSDALADLARSIVNLLQFSKLPADKREYSLQSIRVETANITLFKIITSEISNKTHKNNDYSDLRQYRQLKELISDIGDHGLKLMADADPEQKQKGITLMRMAISFRKQVDDYFKSKEKKDLNEFKNMLITSAEYFMDEATSPVSLTKHHCWLTQAVNIVINFFMHIFNGDSTYQAIQTTSTRKVNRFEDALLALAGPEEPSNKGGIKLSL